MPSLASIFYAMSCVKIKADQLCIHNHLYNYAKQPSVTIQICNINFYNWLWPPFIKSLKKNWRFLQDNVPKVDEKGHNREPTIAIWPPPPPIHPTNSEIFHETQGRQSLPLCPWCSRTRYNLYYKKLLMWSSSKLFEMSQQFQCQLFLILKEKHCRINCS